MAGGFSSSVSSGGRFSPDEILVLVDGVVVATTSLVGLDRRDLPPPLLDDEGWLVRREVAERQVDVVDRER